MAAEVDEQVTEEQAAEALRQLIELNKDDEDDAQVSVTADQPAAPATVQAETAEQPAKEAPPELTATETQVAAEPAETDDVASLKQRTQRLEQQVADAEKRFNDRLEAIKQREAQTSRILRDRMLRKSTVADKALKVLRQSRSTEGVPEAEVDRIIGEIESTMNPASPSYAPPEPAVGAASEDQVLVLNQFLNERGMTSEESEEFGKWIRSEASTKMSPTEQAVAQESLNGFLHLAHARWREGVQQKQTEVKADAIGAVRSVQQTQRAAARAATSIPAAPKKTSVGSPSKELDLSKLTHAQVAELIRKSTEQYM